MRTNPRPLAHWLVLALLGLGILGVALDLRGSLAQGEVHALRSVEPANDASEGSVDAFCGFAPCGMPLPCE